MSRRLLAHFVIERHNGNYEAKVYRDALWDEYRVVYKFPAGGVEPLDATSHHGDRYDAEQTAKQELRRMTCLTSPASLKNLKPDAPVYEVLAGNVGSVYVGMDYREACAVFKGYVGHSQRRSGRVAGESVTLFAGEDIRRRYEAPEQA